MSEFVQWLRGGTPRNFIQAGLSDDGRRLLRNHLETTRALSVASPDGGGLLAPETFENRLIAALDARSSAFTLLSQMRTPTGGELHLATADDTANQGTIQPEGSTRAELDPSIGRVRSVPYTFSSGLCRFSLELLEDSELAEASIAELLGERIKRGLDRTVWAGYGPGQPLGLLRAAGNVVTGDIGTSGSVLWANLHTMTNTITAAYRFSPSGQPRARWVMNGTTFDHIASQVSGSGDERATVKTDPETGPSILGFGVTIDDNVPAMGAGARSLAFGDFEAAAVLRVVQGIRLARLVELYATSGQVGLLAELRGDVLVMNRNAYCVFQHSAT